MNASEEALLDIKNGKLTIRCYGHSRRGESYYWDILTERYGIERVGVAGCVVEEDLTQQADDYNAIMVAEIQARFGTDIFDKAWEEAELRLSERQSENVLSNESVMQAMSLGSDSKKH